MAGKQSEAGNTVFIGIDFGTTYSGVAFTWSKKIERIEVISSWDSDLHSNANEDKAPTAVSLGKKSEVSWGYGIPSDADQLKWFKLLLIDNEDLPQDVRDSTKLEEARDYLKKHNKTALEVTALCLRHLWNHSIQRITESVSRSLINYSKFHVVITLPAIWPEYARIRMSEAARLAGILGTRIAGDTELTFVSEPEAAALATLSDMEDRCDIKVAGDTFVVVDCGGGTIDIISYEVTNPAPMKVKECVKGQGGLCGAVFVDENFTEVLKKKVHKNKWTKMTNESRCRLLHDEWENGIKPAFDGRERVWKLPMPFECLDAKKLRSGAPLPKIILTADDVREAFDPVVGKIRAMVDEQVAAVKVKKRSKPKYVIMAGGFGRCRYLYTVLSNHLGGDIEVLQSRGSGPWTAICRGAVIHGLTLQQLSTLFVDVEARVARASYGIIIHESWNERKHDPTDKYWDECWQAWRAKNQMSWLLKMGDSILAARPTRKRLTGLILPEEATSHRFESQIHLSTSSIPPRRVDGSVKKVCCIKWDAEIDVLGLPTFTNALGKVYYELNFEVEMTCAGGSLDFAVYHDGKRLGSKSVVLDYEIGSS